MNCLILVICVNLIVNIPPGVVCSECESCSGRRIPNVFTNSSENNTPRQVLGYNEVSSFFGTVLRYVQYGFNFISERIGRVVLGPKKGRISYKGYQVLRIDAVNEIQVEHLNELPEEIDGTEYWTPPTDNHFTDLLVSPDSMEDVKDYLKEKKIDYEILIRDLQKVISFENPKMNKEQRDLLIGKRGHPMTWVRYHRYPDMIRYMEFLAFSFPQLVEIITIGYTTEGLPLKVLKVFSGTLDGENNKPAFWIDGGMHAREWITSSVVLYLVKQLVENYNKYRDIVDSAVWYFLAVANPDGYEYSHSTDRLWKKTRSRQDFSESNLMKQLLFGICEGVDLNRNFAFHWGERGTSSDPCREKYAGPRPLSEPESKAITDFILNNKDNIKLFLTLHSYSQKWLIPWSYTSKKSQDYKKLEKMAKKAAQAIELATGSHYDVGSSSSLLYPISGTSEDWAKGVAGIKYSYAIKLRDRGSFGFLLPAAQIVPTAKEIFVAVKVLAKIITSKKQE